MKIGSVKFFKIVILSGFALIISIPIILSICFGIQIVFLKKENKAVKSELDAVITSVKLADEEQKPLDLQQASANTPPSEAKSFEYQTLYPELYCEKQETILETQKVAYLTFDDGPSANTLKVLEILAQNDIKATFFVTGPSSEAAPEYLKAIVDAGHSLGVHSYSHKYAQIYANTDAYLADFEKMYSFIKTTTGVAPTLFRFPGGSINAYNSLTYMPIIAEMTRRGFTYYDWNVSSGDVALRATKNEIVANVLNGASNRERCIVLMHDRLDTTNTILGLPEIISGLKEQGYIFKAITGEVSPITFGYNQ